MSTIYDSYMRNCRLIPRSGDEGLFVFDDSKPQKVYCRLDGYTILPTEQFDRIQKLADAGAEAIAKEAISKAVQS